MIDTDRLAPIASAAHGFGWMVAANLMAPDDAVATLLYMAHNAQVRGDASGVQARVTWLLRDAATAAGIARNRAAWAVRDAIDPLLAQRPRLPAARIDEAAAQAARGLILPHELSALVAARMQRAMQTDRTAKAAHGR